MMIVPYYLAIEAESIVFARKRTNERNFRLSEHIFAHFQLLNRSQCRKLNFLISPNPNFSSATDCVHNPPDLIDLIANLFIFLIALVFLAP